MSESQISLRKRRELPSQGPEQTALRKIVSTLLLLDLFTLRTLQTDIKSTFYHTFRQLTEENLDKINHDGQSDPILLKTEINRYVRTLSGTNLDQIVMKPIDIQFYHQMIYLRIKACEMDNEEEEALALFEESTWGVENQARQELHDIVDVSRTLYMHVKSAAASGYLQQTLEEQLKVILRSIDENIEDACSFLRIQHQPLVYTDDTDKKEIPKSSSNNPQNASIEQEKPNSVFAFLVPVICTLSAIPALFTFAHAGNQPGKVTDSDFFQLLASAPVQLLGISTALWPIINNLRPDRAAWILSWTLATISACFTIAAVPLYLLASTTWSGMSLFAGSFMQSFLQLQLIRGISMGKGHED